jgi:hypothetical protein
VPQITEGGLEPARGFSLADEAGLMNDTLEEVRLIAQYARSTPEAPLILVISKYHVRRVSVIWKTVTDGRPPAVVRYTPE